MDNEEIKKAIIDTLNEQNAFKDLRPVDIVSMTVDMMVAIAKKAVEQQ
jgi:hypothetical protein